jgi:hypothetical protein
MLTNIVKPLINATSYYKKPITPELHFCGYSVLKKELDDREAKIDTILGSIIRNTSIKEQESLLQMHFSKVKIVNHANDALDKYPENDSLSIDYNLGICSDEKKLQSAWKHIDSITNVSTAPSWSTAILLGSITTAISSSLNNTETSYPTAILSNIIYCGSFAIITKLAYKFIRDITGSKPELFQLTNIKTKWEKHLSDYAINKNLTDSSVSQKDREINKSVLDMSDFPEIFDNLYRFLGVSKDQTLALFNATLIGIVDTWIEISYKQLSTDDKTTQIDKAEVNKKIIKNTLVALELNRLTFQDQNTIKEEEYDILTAALRARHSINVKDLNLKDISISEAKNTFKNNLSDLKQGFYTINVDTFLALRVTESFKGKEYCLFMPLLNTSYQTSSVDDICNLLSNFAEYRTLNVDKIGGEIEQV